MNALFASTAKFIAVGEGLVAATDCNNNLPISDMDSALLG